VSDFLVVTSAGVEFYLVIPERKTLKLVKSVSQSVSWSVYSHETRLLLLASGTQDNVIHGMQVQPHAIVRIPKFEVQLAPMRDDAPLASGQQKPRRSLQPGHLSVARLYNMIFCVHVEPELQQVFLYQLYKDFVIRKHALQLYSSQVAVSVSDNLLIVHAVDSRVVLLFDIKINSRFPVTAPLPLATLPGDEFGALYSPHWTFGCPDYVIDPQAGRVGQLVVDLNAVARSSIDRCCLLQFLLARSNAQEVILEVLRRAIEEQEGLATIARMLDLICAAVAVEMLEQSAFGGQAQPGSLPALAPAGGRVPQSRSGTDDSPVTQSSVSEDASGSALPPGDAAVPRTAALPSPAVDLTIGASSQPRTRAPSSRQIVARVFWPAIKALPQPPDGRSPERRHLIGVITEYLHAQYQHALPADEELAIALLDILAQQGSYYQLHQLVQYHIVADSPRLVSQLLALVPEYEPASQLALDMLKRLGPSAHEAILHQLLKQGELLAACRMIRHQRLLSVAPKPFLSAASGSTDPSVFPAVYSFFLQRNLASRGSPEFLAEEQCEEFVLLWERIQCRCDEPPSTQTGP